MGGFRKNHAFRARVHAPAKTPDRKLEIFREVSESYANRLNSNLIFNDAYVAWRQEWTRAINWWFYNIEPYPTPSEARRGEGTTGVPKNG